MLISLQQEDRRRSKKVGKGDNIIIGFEIFKVGSHLHNWFRVCSEILFHSGKWNLWQIEAWLSQRDLALLSTSSVCILDSVTTSDIRQTIWTALNLVQCKLYLKWRSVSHYYLLQKNSKCSFIIPNFEETDCLFTEKSTNAWNMEVLFPCLTGGSYLHSTSKYSQVNEFWKSAVFLFPLRQVKSIERFQKLE